MAQGGLTLTGCPDDVPQARSLVREQLSDRRYDACREDVLLVVSELVTNAVLHGKAPAEFSLKEDGDAVVVRVSDHSGQRPRARRPRPLDEHGRGLMLVAGVSRDWGVRRSAYGKTVWCEVPL